MDGLFDRFGGKKKHKPVHGSIIPPARSSLSKHHSVKGVFGVKTKNHSRKFGIL
jgi:hypothetical protein